MTDKTKPEGFSKRQATEDDVEGHLSRQRTADGDGFARAKVDGEGFARAKATTEDDVEGHGYRRLTPDGISKAKTTEGISHRKATEDDDVEGHSLLDPFAARELSRARERDIQQHAKRHEFERDARDAKKDRS